MRANLAGLMLGAGVGFLFAWARLSDPTVCRAMLLLEEPDVYLLMGSAMAVAAVGVRVLRSIGARTLLGAAPVAWSVERPAPRHVVGAAVFGVGWALAGTCPGPLAVMIGQGHFGGLGVAAGVFVGVKLQGVVQMRWAEGRQPRTAEV